MRLFVFSLLAVAVVSAAAAEVPGGIVERLSLIQKRESNGEKNCKPLKMFKKYCNTCICAADGKTSTCTNDECIEGVYTEDGQLRDYDPTVKHNCVPYKHFTANCNDCWCDFNGITATCTADLCEKVSCEPNKVTRTGCKECTCNASGEQLTCYSKYCPDPVFD